MDNPIIALAAWFQFGPGERVVHARLESRMLLWCTLGTMRIRIAGEWRDLHPDDWLLLPWGQEVIYEAGAVPCLVGSIHLLPHHDRRRPVEFQVATAPGQALARARWRRDAEWPGLDGLRQGRLGGSEPLRLLASYLVGRFQRGPRGESDWRTFAALLRDEIQRAARETGRGPLPAGIRRIEEFASGHLQRPITVAEMARVAGVSAATVHRLFRVFLKTSPYRWLAARRMAAARDLLRTTNLSIAEVGAGIGLPDPFHFSRFFKRNAGIAPAEFRRQTRLF